MKIHTLKYIALFCLLWLVACQSQDTDEALSQASLTVTFQTNDSSSRSLEKVVDGQRMYRLAVALAENGTIIKTEQLNDNDVRFSTNKDVATVTFTNLEYGKPYTLLAVANYGNYDTYTQGNLANVDDLTGTSTVTASTDFLCPKNIPYPLSLKKEIILQPGANTIAGELMRTYARLRIHVRNQNQEKELKITGLSFGNKFTQTSASLFKSDEVGNATVTPNVISQDAITSFANPATIATNTETTIFDAYLLESKKGNYTYTLNLEYEGALEQVYNVNATQPITDSEDIENGGIYVIYNTDRQDYLYANGNRVSAGDSFNQNGYVNLNYVWRLTKKDNGENQNYFVESIGTNGYFMQSSGVTTELVPLVSNNGDGDYFTIQDGMYFKSTSSNRYLRLNSSSNVEGGNSSATRRQFFLYRVTQTTQTTDVTHEAKNIPITTINKETGEAIPITEINRNDFIDILVNVNYNEKTGTFLFEVANWDEKEGELEFN